MPRKTELETPPEERRGRFSLAMSAPASRNPEYMAASGLCRYIRIHGLHGTNSGGKASTCHLTVGDTADILEGAGFNTESHFSLGAQPASAGACDYVALAVLMR